MTNRKTLITTFGFLGLFFLSWFIPSSKIQVLSILADAQALQEVSPKIFFLNKSLDKEKLVNAQIKFGFKLFSTLARQNSEQNIAVSPVSLALALSMLYNGASGTTRQEMSGALGIKGVDLNAFNYANKTLEKSLKTNDYRGQLAIANSLWTRQGFSFRYQFLKTNQEYYQAQITNLNFDSSESVGIINRWVKDKTLGKIPQIIEQISNEDVLFLANAIYFKGVWQIEFDPHLTTQQPFYLSNDRVIKFPLMSREGKYRYFETSDFQAVSLPYAGERFSLEIFLPRPDKNLKDLVSQLTISQWKKWIGQFREQQGRLKLPRFSLSNEIDIEKALIYLGMSTIFEQSSANFSKLTSRQVYVNRIRHKTLVEINEKGTHSAVTSSFRARMTSVFLPEEQFTMIVNRPFLCTIRDHKTNAIIFMGVVKNPN
ncbi:serpin family protein [cyanobacterium endosymbiont of Epithemia turgida]|uniref:serpin family protein n=1 Tax=cyanobacterium endosymbiont of Epithemia turgida TaxID=718217 RepID=UPI0004D137A8|nr:serpin family protein [cyanobacterium endosymbiont of Epithemia turgida]BAP17477.1 proteinase inhibitor I4 serpin [cyanobacterium endosymbiont of Epithemia turgida isolate EtSB Lake Yunoko]